MPDDNDSQDINPDDIPKIIYDLLTANPKMVATHLEIYRKKIESGELNASDLKKQLFLVSAYLIDDSIKNTERAEYNLLKVAQIERFGLQHPAIVQRIMSLSSSSFDDLVEQSIFEDTLDSYLLENNRNFYDELYKLLDDVNCDKKIMEYLEPYNQTTTIKADTLTNNPAGESIKSPDKVMGSIVFTDDAIEERKKKLSDLFARNPETIPMGSFNNSRDIRSVNLPSSVKKIGKNTFATSQIESILLPEGLTSIGDYAFSNCPNLKSIIIPSSVKEIHPNAFENSSLQEIFLPDHLSQKVTFGDNVKVYTESRPKPMLASNSLWSNHHSKNQKPKTKNQKPKTKNQKPKTKNQKPKIVNEPVVEPVTQPVRSDKKSSLDEQIKNFDKAKLKKPESEATSANPKRTLHDMAVAYVKHCGDTLGPGYSVKLLDEKNLKIKNLPIAINKVPGTQLFSVEIQRDGQVCRQDVKYSEHGEIAHETLAPPTKEGILLGLEAHMASPNYKKNDALTININTKIAPELVNELKSIMDEFKAKHPNTELNFKVDGKDYTVETVKPQISFRS